MIALRIGLDIRGFEALARTVLRQAPFAVRDALNETAKDFQRAEQHLVQREFDLKQIRYILNTIKVGRDGFARADKLSVSMGIDPERNQLAKWERGGRKTAFRGEQWVAIPSRDIKRTKRGLVPRSLYPSSFGPFRDVDRGALLAVGQRGAYILDTNAGPLLIQRTGPNRTRAIALFKPSVELGPGRLHFYETARAVARTAWPINLRRAWAENITNARVR